MAKNCPDIIMSCNDGCMRAGYAYVPVQNVNRFYDYASAFAAGTIFPELNLPKGKYGPNENFS
ncbi:MAG: spore coat associated protein CotJA [Bacillota bacterium]|nr:spore coat associated protein CotJA [Bacillota bacterium]